MYSRMSQNKQPKQIPTGADNLCDSASAHDYHFVEDATIVSKFFILQIAQGLEIDLSLGKYKIRGPVQIALDM